MRWGKRKAQGEEREPFEKNEERRKKEKWACGVQGVFSL